MNSGDNLTWYNVGLAFSFIALNAVISKIFHLGIGVSLVTAAVRCMVQLALVATLLQSVFETDNPWAVAAIACELVSTVTACSAFLSTLYQSCLT